MIFIILWNLFFLYFFQSHFIHDLFFFVSDTLPLRQSDTLIKKPTSAQKSCHVRAGMKYNTLLKGYDQMTTFWDSNVKDAWFISLVKQMIVVRISCRGSDYLYLSLNILLSFSFHTFRLELFGGFLELRISRIGPNGS